MNFILSRPGVTQFIPRTINRMKQPVLLWHSEDPPPAGDIARVIRWGCTANIPRTAPCIIFNPARGIHRVYDKRRFRHILNEAGIGPITFFSVESYATYLRDRNLRSLPVIIRPEHHERGQGLFRANTPQEATGFCNRLERFYMTQYVDKVAEYRIFVANNRCVYVANKVQEAPGSVVWQESYANIRWGSWPLAAVDMAIRAHALSGLDTSGVDVMIDAEGTPYVLEINSAPSPCTGYIRDCTAAVFDYMLTPNTVRHLLPDTEQQGWRRYIHPVLWQA